jgi:hypothetical protein
MITPETVYFMIVNQYGTEANEAPADNKDLEHCIALCNTLQRRAIARGSNSRYSVMRVATVYTAAQ